jgi:hypothetical protein
VVAYGRQILANHPNARYIQADIRELEGILESPVVRDTVGDGRKVAIGLNAVTCFLSDAEIQRILRTLYEWAPVGSKLFASFETKTPELMTPKMQQFVDMFDQMGTPYHFLTLEESRELTKPWVVEGRGFCPLAQLLGLPEAIPEEDREGVGLEFYGAVLVKPSS